MAGRTPASSVPQVMTALGNANLNVGGREADFRVSSLPTIHGENIVLRVLDKSASIVPLERLAERHEALTQSVELMVAENRQAAEKMVAENKQMAAENKQRDRRLGEIMEGIASLLHVAELHEQRLAQHDARLDTLQ